MTVLSSRGTLELDGVASYTTCRIALELCLLAGRCLGESGLQHHSSAHFSSNWQLFLGRTGLATRRPINLAYVASARFWFLEDTVQL